MRKRVICRALALAMAALVAAPQTGVTTMAATKTAKKQEVKASVKEEEAKTGDNITEINKTSWSSSVTLVGIEHYGDYESSISEIKVNDTIYAKDYAEGDKYYSGSFSGLELYLGAFVEGDNKITIKAAGYKDKMIVIHKDGDTYTLVSQKDGDSTAQPDPTPTPTPSIQDPKEDGVYTVAWKATKEGSEEESSIGKSFEGKAKLTVKDGEMKLSMLNIAMTNYLIDFTLETDGTFAQSEKQGYGETDSNGGYDAYEYTMNIKDLSKIHKAAALVSMMGGTNADKGNYEKYMKADITFTSVEKGWKGYDKKDAKQTLIDALIEAGCDANGDGQISETELAEFAPEDGVLDLSNSGLSDVSMLKGLSDKVTELDLTNNKITKLPDGFFDHMTNLEEVYLNSNYLTKLPENIFKNNKKLTRVEISYNKLSKIEKDNFSNLPQLSIFQIEGNNISAVEEGAFDGDSKLQSIYAVDNEMTDLPEGLFKDAQNLTFIDFSNNYFTKLPKCIGDAHKLKTIHVKNNALTDISSVDFSKLEDLYEVNFYKNYIKEVADGTFANNKKLYSVDFHDNQISNMSSKVFADTLDNGDDNGVLHKLDITLNNIKVVDPALIKKSDQSYNKFYPQKTAMNLQLKKDGDHKISWNQDLSVLDLAFWFDKTASDEARELETVQDYKDMLERNGWLDKNIADVMSEKYEWDIDTEIQEKNTDGTWKTVKEDTITDKAESLTGSYDANDKGTYRIAKVLSATLNGVKQYRFTVYSNEVDLSKQDTIQTPTNPTTTEKPATTTVINKVTTAVKAKLSKVTKLKVKNKKKRKAVITWKKVKNASGYQIYRATKKNGKFKKVKTVKGNSVVKYTNTKLKKNKKYYYKVRAYRTVKGKKVYGAFSVKKSVSIKK